jgi:hypothetical protein
MLIQRMLKSVLRVTAVINNETDSNLWSEVVMGTGYNKTVSGYQPFHVVKHQTNALETDIENKMFLDMLVCWLFNHPTCLGAWECFIGDKNVL